LVLREIGEKKKEVQFAKVFYLLKEGLSMIKYESIKDLCSFLKFKNMPTKNQFDNLGRDITKCMHYVFL
jgi:hypothetical protein